MQDLVKNKTLGDLWRRQKSTSFSTAPSMVNMLTNPPCKVLQLPLWDPTQVLLS